MVFTSYFSWFYGTTCYFQISWLQNFKIRQRKIRGEVLKQYFEWNNRVKIILSVWSWNLNFWTIYPFTWTMMQVEHYHSINSYFEQTWFDFLSFFNRVSSGNLNKGKEYSVTLHCPQITDITVVLCFQILHTHAKSQWVRVTGQWSSRLQKVHIVQNPRIAPAGSRSMYGRVTYRLSKSSSSLTVFLFIKLNSDIQNQRQKALFRVKWTKMSTKRLFVRCVLFCNRHVLRIELQCLKTF